MQRYKDLIEKLGQAPDTQLDEKGSKMCREWDGQDPVRFLRDLLDLIVRYAWGSRFIVMLLELNLVEPESEEDKEQRRSALLAKWES